MPSRRKEIRTNIATALNAIAAVDGRVYPSRVYPVETLPAIAIYVPGDAVNENSRTIDGEFKRFYECVVEIMVKQSTDFDDTFDDIADEVEDIVTQVSLPGLCIKYESTEIEYSGESEKPTAVGKILFMLI